MSDSPDGFTSTSSSITPSVPASVPAAPGKQSQPRSLPTSPSAPPETAPLSSGDPANRRRGSRGGRKRRSSGTGSGSGSEALAEENSASEYDRRPADLPDSPFEGVASPEAAARAEVRPRIGDSRPAQVNAASGREGRSGLDGPETSASTDSDTSRISGQRSGSARKSRRGGRAKTSRGESMETVADSEQDSSPRGPRPSRSERIAAALDDDTLGEGGAEPAQTRGGDRNARRNGPKAEKLPTASSLSPVTETRGEDDPRRGRRGGNAPKTRGRGSSPAAELIERPRGRERNGRPVGRFLMCVHAHPKATQIAVLEGRSLIEHYVSRPTDNANQIHGNIYLGRVQNVLPGMEAAFVDIGTPKNAVVYRGDLQFDAGDIESSGKKKDDVRIEQVLKNRQLVLCQVTKNPIGSKGARLTQDVSIPGRFVVLVPNSDTYGISKRLGDDERKRLRRILDELRPEKHGLIVRTAAEGATPDELQRDVALLLRQWEAIEAKAKKANSPMLLHKEPDMAVRVIREEFNQNYRGIVIDDRELYEEVRSYVESISPSWPIAWNSTTPL